MMLSVLSACHGNVKALAIGAIKDYPTWEWSLVDKVYHDRRIPCSKKNLMPTRTLYDHRVSTQVMGLSWWRSIKV